MSELILRSGIRDFKRMIPEVKEVINIDEVVPSMQVEHPHEDA